MGEFCISGEHACCVQHHVCAQDQLLLVSSTTCFIIGGKGGGVQFWECMEREQDQKLLHKGSRDGALHPACLDSDWIK